MAVLNGRLARQVPYWDAWCLSFSNQEWEEAFSSHCHIKLSPLCTLSFMTMVYGIAIFKSRSSLCQSLQSIGLFMLMSWVIVPFTINKLWEWKGCSHRFWNLLKIVWKCCLPLHVVFVSLHSAEGRSVQIDDMLIKISLLLFTMSMCTRFTFKNILMYHTVSSLVGFVWTMKSCEYLGDATKFSVTAELQKKAISFLYSSVLLGVGFPAQVWENPVSTCAATTFLNIGCSWIVPLFIIYSKELRSRRDFLRCRVPQNNILNVEQNAVECHRAAICTAALTSFVVLGSLDLLMK